MIYVEKISFKIEDIVPKKINGLEISVHSSLLEGCVIASTLLKLNLDGPEDEI